MLLTGLFIKMSNGATYAVVPFVNRRALGAVAGIVGAGGNVGAVLAGFLFKTSSLTWPQALLILGIVVSASAALALLVRFCSGRTRANMRASRQRARHPRRRAISDASYSEPGNVIRRPSVSAWKAAARRTCNADSP